LRYTPLAKVCKKQIYLLRLPGPGCNVVVVSRFFPIPQLRPVETFAARSLEIPRRFVRLALVALRMSPTAEERHACELAAVAKHDALFPSFCETTARKAR